MRGKLIGLGAGALLVAGSLVPVMGSGIARANAPARIAAATQPAAPHDPYAKEAKKYKGQSITFIGDNSIGTGHDRDVQLDKRFFQDTGIKVNEIPHPNASDASYEQLARLFNSHSSSVDVMMLDVVWPGAFAPYLVDLKPSMGKQLKNSLSSIVSNDTINGHTVGAPWFGDYGILYYRTDLLKKYGYKSPPTTWAQLTAMSKKVMAGERKKDKNFWGFVFQGNAYEGLTCDSLEWIASSGGGTFFSGHKDTVNNPKAIAAMNMARSWVGTISPPGVTSYMEEDARNIFDGGHALFMRNWPYAYSASQTTPVKGKFDVTVLPHGPGGHSVGTVGGWQLGVSKFSKHQGAAIEFVKYLTSTAVERYDAINDSNVPVIPSVLHDPAVVKTNPYLKPAIANVPRVTRPSRFLGPHYLAGSQAIFQAMNRILNGSDASSVLPALQQQLQRITP